jgi:hypothetical protein
MGMDFVLDEKIFFCLYRLVDKESDALTLLCVGRCILQILHSINEKGF